MKSFHQFYEQAVAAAPAPAPAAPKPAAKAQSKAKPKVTDPSTGVDIDDKGRWQGDIVDQGKELEPEQKIKIKDGRKGPDPNLPSGEANPNKKKDDDLIAQADNRKMPDYVRDSIRRQYKGGPDYKIEDMKNVINWNKKKA